MANIPIIRMGDILVATVQEDIVDRDALSLQDDLATLLLRNGSRGVLIDISIVETIDSFLGRLINDIAAGMRLLGAQTVLVGMKPAVAVTLVELGLELPGVRTALTAEKGMALIRRAIVAGDKKNGASRGP